MANSAPPLANPREAEADGRPMLAPLRHERIMRRLHLDGSVSVSALADEMRVSEMTVRRDLVELERAGKLARIHGGAIATEMSLGVEMDREEPSFDSRLRWRHDAKSAIAEAAANMVCTFRSVAIDVGTTTYMMAKHLGAVPHLRAFTNSLRIADVLTTGGIETYVPGGRVRPDEMSIGGPVAIAQFDALWFDAVVIGASGITTDGLFDYSFDDTDMKRVYLRRSGVKIVVCDAAKFQRMSLVKIAALEEIDVLFTDVTPPPALAAALAAARVDVRVVDIRGPRPGEK